IMAELRREEPREARPGPKDEEAKRCRYCERALEVKAGTGRRRHYCNDKCRVADFRKRRRSAAQLVAQTELQERWKQHLILNIVSHLLQDLLQQYGVECAHAATEAILLAISEQHEGNEHLTAEGCRFCGRALDDKTGTGRTRHYCNVRCRVADYRRR